MKNLYVVCYDISNDNIRSKVEKVISQYGIRVQYSVFECRLTTGLMQEMKSKLKKLFKGKKIDINSDSIRIYRICDMCRTKMEMMGAVTTINDKYMII